MQCVECPLRRCLLRNVGLYDRKVRPRFRHLKQQRPLLLVRRLGGSSGTIECSSPIMNWIRDWACPWISNRTKLSRNQCPHGVAVPSVGTGTRAIVLSRPATSTWSRDRQLALTIDKNGEVSRKHDNTLVGTPRDMCGQPGTNNRPQSFYPKRKAPPAPHPDAFRFKSPVRPAGLFLSTSPSASLAWTPGTAARLRRWQINLSWEWAKTTTRCSGQASSTTPIWRLPCRRHGRSVKGAPKYSRITEWDWSDRSKDKAIYESEGWAISSSLLSRRLKIVWHPRYQP